MTIKSKKQLTIAITGNRYPDQTDYQLIETTIKKIVFNKNIKEIVFGGAIGVDSIALLYALKFRENAKLKTPKLTVVVPDKLTDQPEGTRDVSAMADELVELKNTITSDDGYNSYRLRNEYMVKRSNRIVAFWDGSPRSGTFMTINLAKQHKKAYEVIDIQGKD